MSKNLVELELIWPDYEKGSSYELYDTEANTLSGQSGFIATMLKKGLDSIVKGIKTE